MMTGHSLVSNDRPSSGTVFYLQSSRTPLGSGRVRAAASARPPTFQAWHVGGRFTLRSFCSAFILVRHIHRTVHRRGNGPQAFHQAMKVVEGQALLAI